MLTVTILISSYCRYQYLQWHLETLVPQIQDQTVDVKIVVLNDGVSDDTKRVCDYWGVNHLFTGQRNQKGLQWRIPGYAFNIGIHQYPSDITILTCAEIYHLGNTLSSVISPLLENSYIMSTPTVYDDHGPLRKYLSEKNDKTKNPDQQIRLVKEETHRRYKHQDPFLANSFMPYFLAIPRQRLLDIGGYDEDFTGIGADDNDLMDRLVASGCKYHKSDEGVVHLHHPKKSQAELISDPRYQHNKNLWLKRKGTIVRNIGKEWGQL